MCPLELPLEIGKCLHKLSHTFARNGSGRLPRVEIADEARQEALGGAHDYEREMYAVMPDAVQGAMHLVPHECGEIDMRQDECDMLDRMVKVGTFFGEEAPAAARLILGKREESGEERERAKNESEVCHG